MAMRRAMPALRAAASARCAARPHDAARQRYCRDADARQRKMPRVAAAMMLSRCLPRSDAFFFSCFADVDEPSAPPRHAAPALDAAVFMPLLRFLLPPRDYFHFSPPYFATIFSLRLLSSIISTFSPLRFSPDDGWLTLFSSPHAISRCHCCYSYCFHFLSLFYI